MIRTKKSEEVERRGPEPWELRRDRGKMRPVDH